MNKIAPHPLYPVEEGQYIRGNDFSPAAVAIILNDDQDKAPPGLVKLIRAGAEAGAALSGFVQTPNIGFEKVICNIVANPNIRYLVLGGPESEGHRTGEALKALFKNGTDSDKKIIGTEALHPVLYNIPGRYIDRFREQVTLIDVQFNDDEDIIKKAVWSCIQEKPVEFNGMELYDKGAFPGGPLAAEINWLVTEPWNVTTDERELDAKKRAENMIQMLRERNRLTASKNLVNI